MDRRICLSGKSPVNNPKQIANSSTNNPGSNKK